MTDGGRDPLWTDIVKEREAATSLNGTCDMKAGYGVTTSPHPLMQIGATRQPKAKKAGGKQ